jgi:putative heme iron utilization protein
MESEKDKKNPINETDAEALHLTSDLLLSAKYMALGVSEIETGVPLVSRVSGVWTPETGLFFVASDLSVHSKCLKENSMCSVMIGEPGKGDGLAHPRITLIGHSQRLPNDYTSRTDLRAAFLKVHPKAELYIDFADFGFYPLHAERALLNGGFGKAYHLNKSDLASIDG